jgi:hypothetical protein
LILALSCALSAQTRRRVIPTTKPTDSVGNMVVTFHGKLTEMSKKDLTIATEDQPAFVIGRSHKTKFLKDGKAIKPEEIPVGAALTVDVTKDPDLNPLAVAVTVDSPAAKPPSDQK